MTAAWIAAASGRSATRWTAARERPKMAAMAKPPPPRSPEPPKTTTSGQGGHAERCAFCGRREIEAGRLIAGAKAAICADCIRRLGEGLRAERSRRPR
jgi:hypothetical protein